MSYPARAEGLDKYGIVWSRLQEVFTGTSPQIMSFKTEPTTNLRGEHLKSNQFTFLGSQGSSSESDVSVRREKGCYTIDWLSILWKSYLPDKIKRVFNHATIVSVLLNGCTIWMLTNPLLKREDWNLSKIQRAVLKKSCMQHSTKRKLYGHLPPITETIQEVITKYAGHCRRS